VQVRQLFGQYINHPVLLCRNRRLRALWVGGLLLRELICETWDVVWPQVGLNYQRLIVCGAFSANTDEQNIKVFEKPILCEDLNCSRQRRFKIWLVPRSKSR
jgi:hypothetical protein